MTGSRLAWLALAFLGSAACDVGPESDERAAPRVLRVTWDDGARDVDVEAGPVAVWAPVDVWFDRLLDPDSVTATRVRLESNDQVVRSVVLYDPLDRRVRMTPARTLDPTLAYRVIVSDKVRSLGRVAAVPYDGGLQTGPATDDAPPPPAPMAWAQAETLIETRCESATCHGDDETVATCGPAAPWTVAVGLELDEPGAIRATAIDVRAHQWPSFSRIEPGRPDRSYVTYKLADFEEGAIIGNLMPTASARGAGFDANGDALAGACCAVDDLPRLHPPPWAEPVGRLDPDALRKRSLAWRTPAVWACACADTRGRFPAPAGRCHVVEGDCGDGVDGDDDGRIDCDDPDCHFADECPHELSCADGADEDADGAADCADPDCAGAPVCEGVAGTPAVEESCADGTDDDGDGAVDCEDFDCALSTACLTGLQAPDAEPVAYCRARGVSDWILAGAPLGPERDACELVCAPRCQAGLDYGDCVAACLASDFDASTTACLRDLTCTAGSRPPLDADGLARVGEGGCTATCRGGEVVRCVEDGAGLSDDCAATCQASCDSIADLCAPIEACGFGG